MSQRATWSQSRAASPTVTPSAQPDACTICLAPLVRRGGAAIINPGCGHQLHLSCFEELLHANPDATCPSCRNPLGAHMRGSRVVPGAPTPFVPMTPHPPSSRLNRMNAQQGPPLHSQSVGWPELPDGYPGLIRIDESVLLSMMFLIFLLGLIIMNRTVDLGWDFYLLLLGGLTGAVPNFYRLASEANPAVDDPIETMQSTKNAQISQYDYSRLIQLSLDPESDPIRCTPTKLTAMLSLTVGSDPNESEERTCLDLVLVVDISGSMSGSKIDSVRDTLRYIVGELAPEDRVAIVLFDSDAKVLCQLKRMSTAGKGQVRELIDGIDAGGGTTIAGGLALGLDILEQRAQKNKSCAVLLLSDGQDMCPSEGSYESLKLRAERDNCPVFTFGIGSDHDANCLTTLSARGGTFTYLDTMAIVKDAFAGAVGALKGIAVKDCKVALQVPSDMKITGVMSGYPLDTRTDTKVFLTFGDLYYEETRNLLVEIELPGCAPQRQLVLGAKADYTVLDTGNAGTVFAPELSVNRVDPAAIPASQSRNAQVMKHKLRLPVSQALAEALKLADGQTHSSQAHDPLESARAMLQRVREEVQSYLVQVASGGITPHVPQAGSSTNPPPPQVDDDVYSFLRDLLTDLDRSLSHLRTRSDLESGGRAFLQTTATTNRAQRSVTAQMVSDSARRYQSKKSADYSARTYD